MSGVTVWIVHLVFNNDPFGDAIRDAARLRSMLGEEVRGAALTERRSA